MVVHCGAFGIHLENENFNGALSVWDASRKQILLVVLWCFVRFFIGYIGDGACFILIMKTKTQRTAKSARSHSEKRAKQIR